MSANAEAQSAAAPEVFPPVAPPVSLYANLPQEWPLARLSVQLRHIGVLLRVTLYRRLAELSFRGVAFCQLPREVMKNICQDFDNICGEMANRLASLFAFLEPFFPRVRTPCGHGAQVIIEGRLNTIRWWRKGQRQPSNKPNKTNHSPQAETPPPSSTSSVLG